MIEPSYSNLEYEKMEENVVHETSMAKISKAPSHAASQDKRIIVQTSYLDHRSFKALFRCQRESHAEPYSGDIPNGICSYLCDEEIHATGPSDQVIALHSAESRTVHRRMISGS